MDNIISQKTIEGVFVHESSFVDMPCTIGKGTKIWHFCHISSRAVIGKNCSLGQNVYVGGRAILGNNVKIQNNVSVYDGVVLEDYVFCGPSMVFTNDMNPRSRYPKNGNYKKTLVKEGASIGANVTVVCGVTIGKHVFIGAGTIVTKDIPDYALVYGIPAKIHDWICECGVKLNFQDSNESACTACKKKYYKENNIVTIL